MKIGVSSYSFSKYVAATGAGLFDLCDKAKAIGFDGIEFTDIKTDDPVATARELRAHCEKIGLEITAYAIGANFLCEDPEAEVARVCGEVDVCAALGAKLMRHDVCYALPKKHPYSWRDAAAQMAPLIRRVTEYAESKGVRTCTENHGYIFQDPARVEALILQVNHPNYGWLCDMGNFMCADADPVKAVTIAAPYAFHVHAKDFLYKAGGECPDGFFPTAGKNWLRGTALGHGAVPVDQCIRILKGAGYEGWLSLEFEGMEDCIPAIETGFRYLKKHA